MEEEVPLFLHNSGSPYRLGNHLQQFQDYRMQLVTSALIGESYFKLQWKVSFLSSQAFRTVRGRSHSSFHAMQTAGFQRLCTATLEPEEVSGEG